MLFMNMVMFIMGKTQVWKVNDFQLNVSFSSAEPPIDSALPSFIDLIYKNMLLLLDPHLRPPVGVSLEPSPKTHNFN